VFGSAPVEEKVILIARGRSSAKEKLFFSLATLRALDTARTEVCASYFEVYFVGVYGVRQSVTGRSQYR